MKPTKAELKQRTLAKKNDLYVKVCNFYGRAVPKGMVARWKLNKLARVD